MSKLESMEVGKNYLYSGGLFSAGYNQELYLKKAKDDGSHKNKYYIIAATHSCGKIIEQGYLYFYLDFDTKSSDFIGTKVFENFRNLNIGSLLVASWIDFCFKYNFNFLGMNKTQRKPFLIYLLKTYGFDVLDHTLYETRSDIISLGRSHNPLDKTKYLLFKDKLHKDNFAKTNIFKSDNYEIIDTPRNIIMIDKVIVPLQDRSKNPVNYKLIDEDLALKKALNVISRHTR